MRGNPPKKDVLVIERALRALDVKECNA